MKEDMQRLAQVTQELVDRVDAVDRKVDQTRVQLEEKIDQTRTELSTLVTATATALERRMDKKLDQKLDRMEQRLVQAADGAVERVLGTVYERFSYDAGALDDRIDAQGRSLDQHIADERIHHTHSDEPG